MTALSHRERVRTALNHHEPDMVPIDLGAGRATTTYIAPYLEAGKILGLKDLKVVTSPRNVLDDYSEEFLEALDIDFRRVKLRYPKKLQGFEPGAPRKDEWGVTWVKSGQFWSPWEPPLKEATIDDLQKYPWPEPIGDEYVEGLKEEGEYKYKNTDYALVACLPHHCYGINTTSYFLRGLDNFMIDLIMNKEFASELMNKVLEVHKQVYGKYLDAVGDFIEVVHAGDDMGTQNAPFFSPDLYKEIVQPRQKELLSFIKSKTKAKVFFHSCGAIFPLLDHMIDAGMDILNPVQHTAKGMEPNKLKVAYGDKLCFQGGVDQQKVLTGGSVEDVREEVKHCIRQLGPRGGYILNAVHNVVPEVPGKNLIAMYKSAREIGCYPISV